MGANEGDLYKGARHPGTTRSSCPVHSCIPGFLIDLPGVSFASIRVIRGFPGSWRAVRGSTPLRQRQQPVGRAAGPALGETAGPAYLDDVAGSALAQAEVEAQHVGRAV